MCIYFTDVSCCVCMDNMRWSLEAPTSGAKIQSQIPECPRVGKRGR